MQNRLKTGIEMEISEMENYDFEPIIYPKYEHIFFEKKDGIATITLNEPKKRNSWTRPLGRDMMDVLYKLRADYDVQVVILTGNQEGKAFSSGADLANPKVHNASALGGQKPILEHMLRGGRVQNIPLFRLLDKFPLPIIAAINGYAIGIGAVVLTYCDILIASENAEIAHSQTPLGLYPAYGGGPRLAQFIGKARASEMILTGQRISAATALQWGLVSRVVPLPKLMPTAWEIAKRIASFSRLGVMLTKQSMVRGMAGHIREASEADEAPYLILTSLGETNERHAAFLGKGEKTSLPPGWTYLND